MGCVGTKVYVVNDKPGQDAKAQADFNTLGLKPDEVNIFYTAFCKIDKDRSGQIEISEFLKSLELEETPMSSEVFSELDRSHDGHSDFREFTLAAWKFCSKGLDSIVDLAFDIYDEDDSNSLTRIEIKNMIIEIYGKTSPKHDVQAILNEFDKDGNSSISRSEFKDMVKKNRNILLPALSFQVKLREFIGSDKFWERILAEAEEVSDRKEVKKMFRQKRKKVVQIKERLEKEKSMKNDQHFKLHGWHEQHHEEIHGTAETRRKSVDLQRRKSVDKSAAESAAPRRKSVDKGDKKKKKQKKDTSSDEPKPAYVY